MTDATPILIVLLIICATLAGVFIYLYIKEKDKKAATVAPGPSPSPCPPAGPTPAPDPKIVKGWSSAIKDNGWVGFTTENENTPKIDHTMKSCAEMAKLRGADAFTLRLPNHATMANTCIGYTFMPAKFTSPITMADVDSHNSACVDPTKTWPDCGTRKSWCVGGNSESGGQLPKGFLYTNGGFAWPTGTDKSNLYAIKTAWTDGLKEVATDTQSLKARGYKYLAVTISNDTGKTDRTYNTFYAFGKDIPPNLDMAENNNGAACNYGGTETSATKFKVGRKGDSYIGLSNPSLKNPGDIHTGNTWRIYDLEQV